MTFHETTKDSEVADTVREWLASHGVTDTKAIEKARATLPEGQQGLAFVAVPVRSWRVRTPKIQTTVKTLWT